MKLKFSSMHGAIPKNIDEVWYSLKRVLRSNNGNFFLFKFGKNHGILYLAFYIVFL